MLSPRTLQLALALWAGVNAVAAQCDLEPDYATPVMADGWESRLVAQGLEDPRGILFDGEGALLVLQRGSGLLHLALNDQGGACFDIAKSTRLINSTDLNHGLAISEDGRTLYASTGEAVFSWEYDPAVPSVSQTNTTLVTGMGSGGHTSRTLLMSRKAPGTLIVSRGSDGNFDAATTDITSGRSQIRAFNVSDAPQQYSDGVVLGWGLRNSVGVAEEPTTGGLYSVENSSDGLERDDVDIHENNPGEELNFHGYLNGSTESQGGNYGYPYCYALWNTTIPNLGNLEVGDQFVLDTSDTVTNDAFCAEERVSPRLTFQAHLAPLDIIFDPNGTEAYISFHGSWNRDDPVGYSLSTVAFDAGAPVAASNSTTATTAIMSNADLSDCPDDCFRPVGLAMDSQGRVFMSSDSTGEIWVVRRTQDTPTTTGGAGGGSGSGGGGSTPTASGPAATGSNTSAASRVGLSSVGCLAICLTLLVLL